VTASRRPQSRTASSSSGRGWLLVYCLLVAGCLLMVGYGADRGLQAARLAGAAKAQVEGTITAKDTASHGSSTDLSYVIEYRFEPSPGRVVYGFESVSSQEWAQAQAGAGIQIEYVTAEPSSNWIAGESPIANLASGAAFFLVLATICLVVISWRFLPPVLRARRRALLANGGISAPGTVDAVRRSGVAYRRDWSSTRLRYHFEDAAGRTWTGSDTLINVPAGVWAPGSSGVVRYNPRRPSDSAWFEGDVVGAEVAPA
jgi:hypothetical protein